jgi:hypothetical protein
VGSFDDRYPFKSSVNLLKALVKHVFGVFGILESRYAMHADNALVAPYVLDDGQRVYQFMRYDNHFNGIGAGAFAGAMHYNLSPRVINQLKAVNGSAILYTHFGINPECETVVCEETQSALRNLETEYRSGEVYVTTTSKLLNYHVTSKYLDWSQEHLNGETVIRIKRINDPVFGERLPTEEDLQGVTFYVPAAKVARILVGESELLEIRRNPADESGRESVTIPQKYLTYPDIGDLDVASDGSGSPVSVLNGPSGFSPKSGRFAGATRR